MHPVNEIFTFRPYEEDTSNVHPEYWTESHLIQLRADQMAWRTAQAIYFDANGRLTGRAVIGRKLIRSVDERL